MTGELICACNCCPKLDVGWNCRGRVVFTDGACRDMRSLNVSLLRDAFWFAGTSATEVGKGLVLDNRVDAWFGNGAPDVNDAGIDGTVGIPALTERVCEVEGTERLGCAWDMDAADDEGCGVVPDLIGAVFDRAGELSEAFDCDGPRISAARCESIFSLSLKRLNSYFATRTPLTK